jgi:GntR family transcriptional regulator, transcriptional repressor for pyruvate dehydrogenase complex
VPAPTTGRGLDERSAGPTSLSAVVLRPVRATNAFESTVEQLATAVRLGVFAQGDRLPPERVLAQSMRVSRATLREAIAALRQAGMVATRSGRGGGTVVTTARPGDGETDEVASRDRAQALVEADGDRFRDALLVRRVVEPGAAFIAANTDVTPGQRDWLRASLGAVAAAAEDRILHRQADSRLHLAIAQLTASPALLGMVTDVQRDLHDLLDAIPVLSVNIAHSNDDHARIVDAILAGHPEEARRVMECHCDATAALLRGLLGMDPTSPRRDGTR